MLGNISNVLWDEVVSTTIYTLNWCPMKVVEGKSSCEAWKRNKPNIAHLRVFVYDAYAFIIYEKRKNLEKIFEKSIFVGYEN